MSERDAVPTVKLAPIFNVNYSNMQLNVMFINECSDAGWGAWFGVLQDALRSQKWEKQSFNRCFIDFTECSWADPLPLLSLAISLLEFEQAGGIVSLKLPSHHDGDRFNERGRLLKFMAREGFLRLLSFPSITILPKTQNQSWLKSREVKIGEQYLTNDLLDELSNLPVPIVFERSTCLPAKMLYLKRPADQQDNAILDDIDEWVGRKLFETIEPVIIDMVPGWAQRGIRYRLLMVLRETIHNIAEHAYNSNGFAAVYVRYREGALGEAPSNWARLVSFLKRERDWKKVPLMAGPSEKESFTRTRTGFFEVFVLDAGQGLCRSLNENCSKSDSAVHKIMLEVFDKGRSRKKGNIRPTQYGGLYLIRQLLEPVHDYLRARDEDTWWGTELPLKKTERGSQQRDQFTMNARGAEHVNKTISGLAWCFRLSWLEKTDIAGPNQPWQGLTEEKYRNDILDVLRGSYIDNNTTDKMTLVDYRFPSQTWDNIDEKKSMPPDVAVLLPQEGWMKNRIQGELLKFLHRADLRKHGVVVVGDIPSEEAVTYLAAIENSNRFKSLKSIIGYFILVTRDLKVCVLERDLDGRFRHSKHYLSALAFVKTDYNLALQPINSLQKYYYALRYHDSRRLWQVVRERESSFIEEPIKWSDGITLNGYFDFPQTLTHPLCRAIYSITLQRLSGLFPRHDCEMMPLDSLVESLVVRFNAEQHPRQRMRGLEQKPLRIKIGSVHVSGLTEQSLKQDRSPVFHFFSHPSGKGKGFYLLSWLPYQSEISEKKSIDLHALPLYPYQRVGHTAVIARNGWKAYRLPRFNSEAESIYEQSPRDSYRAWQEPSRTPMKIGHWSYGGHHDLLTLNLMLAFDTELDRINVALGGSLARYIYANLFCCFGLNKEHLNDKGAAILEAISRDGYQHILSDDLAKLNTILIYPSHPVTDHIIDRFLSLIKDQILNQIRSRLFPVLPIRRHRRGSGLQISGLIIERLKNVKRPKPPVVIFDDAIISSRTYAELTSLLRSLEFTDVRSLIILDRQRLPSAEHVDGIHSVCYWRLDLPTMGSRNHCSLCNARRRVQDLAEGLTSKEHRNRIESWRESWRPLMPSTQWGDGGVRPIPLWLNKPQRKFGIEPDPANPGKFRQIGGDVQKIRITNTAGLVAYVSELHSITSQDNYSLRILATEDLDPQARIQLFASQLLLFASEFDRTLALELGLQLLQALWDAEQYDRHTALAALALIACGDDFLLETIDMFLTEERSETIKNRNMDVISLLALANIADRSLRGSRKILRIEDFEVINRLLKPSDKLDIYKRFHREVKDALGKCHSGPLHRLKQIVEHGDLITEHYVKYALGSIDQIHALIDGIQHSALRPETDGHKDYGLIRGELKRIGDELRKELLGLETKIHKEKGSPQDTASIRHLAESLLNQADKLHTSIFHPLGIDGMKKEEETKDCLLLEELRQLLLNLWPVSQANNEGSAKRICWHQTTAYENKLNSNRITTNKKDLVEAFVLWDRDVTDALKDILTNVKYASGPPFKDPWDKKGISDEAYMWGLLELHELFAVIELRNRSNQSVNVVREKTKNNYSLSILREIGGVEYDEDENGWLRTIVRLPYAHTLKAINRS